MAIVPDTKDWTWVLDRPCPECGFDARAVAATGVAAALRVNAEQWVAALARAGIDSRPAPDRWSVVEYACHVRDVFVLYLERLDLMLRADDPLFANWDQDVTAVERRYDEQHASTVAAELTAAATALADRFDSVDGADW